MARGDRQSFCFFLSPLLFVGRPLLNHYFVRRAASWRWARSSQLHYKYGSQMLGGEKGKPTNPVSSHRSEVKEGTTEGAAIGPRSEEERKKKVSK